MAKRKRRQRLPGFAINSKRWRVTCWEVLGKMDTTDLDDYPPVKPKAVVPTLKPELKTDTKGNECRES